MKIALDYDKTYSADPDFWNLFIWQCKRLGHEIKIVTARSDIYDRTAQLVELEKLIEVVYCRGVAKRWFMTHHGNGFVPDIWIDDDPESILINSTINPTHLANWRETRGEGDVIKE